MVSGPRNTEEATNEKKHLPMPHGWHAGRKDAAADFCRSALADGSMDVNSRHY